MSIKDRGCGTVSIPRTPLQTVACVQHTHSHCDTPVIKKRRIPFMVNWCAGHAPYPPGSLVIHDCGYWWASDEEYAPPGSVNTHWKPFDLESWLRASSKLMEAESSFLSFPVYQEPKSCGIPLKLNGQRIAAPEPKAEVRVFSQDSIVISQGKLYYALHDNACTYPPSSQWGGGVSLNDLILKLLKEG